MAISCGTLKWSPLSLVNAAAAGVMRLVAVVVMVTRRAEVRV